MFKFESSAIDNISDVQDGQVVVTFNGGRDYTYDVADPAEFLSNLQLVIDNDDSVGKFINLAIRGEALKATIAWSTKGGSNAPLIKCQFGRWHNAPLNLPPDPL